MKQKGILFTFMVFILLSGLLALHQANDNQEKILSRALSESTAFKKVTDKYTNLKNNFSILTTNEAEKAIDKRILPFDYTIDANDFTLSATLPVSKTSIEEYLEILNAFRIFVEDSNYSKEYDSLAVDINTLNPETWGGNDVNISFAIMPQCINYSIEDTNKIIFSSACEDFNYSSIRTQTINLSLKSAHDFNSLICNFNGEGTCFNESYDYSNPYPYLDVTLDDSACSNCVLSQTRIRGHFNPLQASTLKIRCSGGSCVSPDIDLNFAGATEIQFTDSTAIDTTISLGVPNNITSFSFSDANISVSNELFGVKIWGN